MVKDINRVCANFKVCLLYIQTLFDDVNTIKIDVVIKRVFYALRLEMIYTVVGRVYFNKKEVNHESKIQKKV